MSTSQKHSICPPPLPPPCRNHNVLRTILFNIYFPIGRNCYFSASGGPGSLVKGILTWHISSPGSSEVGIISQFNTSLFGFVVVSFAVIWIGEGGWQDFIGRNLYGTMFFLFFSEPVEVELTTLIFMLLLNDWKVGPVWKWNVIRVFYTTIYCIIIDHLLLL